MREKLIVFAFFSIKKCSLHIPRETMSTSKTHTGGRGGGIFDVRAAYIYLLTKCRGTYIESSARVKSINPTKQWPRQIEDLMKNSENVNKNTKMFEPSLHTTLYTRARGKRLNSFFNHCFESRQMLLIYLFIGITFYWVICHSFQHGSLINMETFTYIYNENTIFICLHELYMACDIFLNYLHQIVPKRFG